MPDISEYYSGGSTLKPDDIDDELTAVVENWRKRRFEDGNESYFLKLAGHDKEFRVNRSNAKRIAEMFGSDIDDWIGKPLTLIVDKVKTPQGSSVDSIIVRIRKTARNAPKGKPVHDERNPPPPFDDDVPFEFQWK